MRSVVAAAMALATAAACVFVTGCGARPATAPTTSVALEPRWQDVFDTLPELFVVVRPRSLRRDKVYGPLLDRILQQARLHSRVVSAARTLDALVDADEVVAGVRSDTADGPGDEILVARGVRGDLDPGKLVDDDGRPLWEPGPAGPVRELIVRRDPHGADPGASLFELPGRTWVFALGNARTHAREAFAHPLGRPDVDLDREALAIVRLDGPSLVQRLRLLQETGSVSAAGHHLQSVTLALPPGEARTVRGTLSYADEDAAALAAVAIPEALRQLVRLHPNEYGWLGNSTFDRTDKRLVMTAPLPTALIDGLVHASAAPVGGT